MSGNDNDHGHGHREDILDESLEESFPASDPSSVTRPHDLDDLKDEDAGAAGGAPPARDP